MDEKDEIQDLIPAYALGILDAEEAAAVEALLAESHTARQELAQYQQVSDALGMAVEPVETSADFEDRLFARIKPAAKPAAQPVREAHKIEPAPQPSFLDRIRAIFEPPVVGFAAGLAALVFILSTGFLFSQNREMSSQLASAQTNLPTIQLGTVDVASSALGLMILSENGANGTIVVDNLDVPSDGSFYKLWMIKDGMIDAGPSLELNPRGYSASWIRTQTPLDSYDRFEVTLEPTGSDSGEPLGDPVLVWSADGS
ncbi:MAG: anti-sigma factor [Chloroflexota bacterium]